MTRRPQVRYTPGFWLPKGSPERLRLEAAEQLLIRRIAFVALMGALLGWANY